MKALKWIFKNLSGLKIYILILSVLNFILSLLSVLFAVYFKNIIDFATSNNTDAVKEKSVVLIILVCISLISAFLSSYIDEYTKTSFGIHLRERILNKLSQKEYSEISSYHTGEINNRIFSDINIVVNTAVSFIPSLINMSVRLVAGFTVLFTISKYFGTVFLLAGLVCLLCLIVFRGKLKFLHKDVQEKEGVVRSDIQETVSLSLLVKIFNLSKKRMNALRLAHNSYKKSILRRKLFSSASHLAMNIVYNAGFLFAFFWCVLGIVKGFITYGDLTAVLQITGQIQGSVSGITGILPSIFSMTASAERLMELEALNDEEKERAEVSDIDEISISNMSFSYGREEVLKDINLTVKKNEVTAILGVSGAGKSTLFMMLLGIYKPVKGSVTVKCNGNEYSAGYSTRHLFSYVPQDNQLFSGTIGDNLKITGKETDDDIHRAIEISCAEFIDELPDKLCTKIGENGFGLSQGQRQRIAIARAILSDAPVILFDEATSALDEATEKRLIENLGKINKTCVIITHRRSILSICKSANIMEDGKLLKEE